MSGEMASLVKKYILAVELALQELTLRSFPSEALRDKVGQIIDSVKSYLTDSKFYLNAGREATALASVSYAEGLLDSLRMMEFVDFGWRRGGS
jgi:FAD synthetase